MCNINCRCGKNSYNQIAEEYQFEDTVYYVCCNRCKPKDATIHSTELVEEFNPETSHPSKVDFYTRMNYTKQNLERLDFIINDASKLLTKTTFTPLLPLTRKIKKMLHK